MTSIALNEAKTWHDELMNAEFRGRGDREKSARGRLSDKTGIPESYLFRLAYKTAEMKDIAGSAYRSLMIAYDEMCERNEAAADRSAAARASLKAKHETTDEKRNQEALRGASPED